jgi:catechol 2,3-dioxygenase-like lactoylglutathione lyase family enzyme
MPLEIRRLILFTPNLPALTVFYQDVLGLDVINRETSKTDRSCAPCWSQRAFRRFRRRFLA